MDYLFFTTGPRGDVAAPAPGFRVEAWRPSPLRPLRRGLPAIPFAWWSLCDLAGLFAPGDYRVVLLHGKEGPVHRTCLLPAHYRFPFMAPGDVQAAAIWTRPDLRGRGVASAGLAAAMALVPDRRVWYMVREDNAASIRLAGKVGFTLHGRGRRMPGWLPGFLRPFQLL